MTWVDLEYDLKTHGVFPKKRPTTTSWYAEVSVTLRVREICLFCE